MYESILQIHYACVSLINHETDQGNKLPDQFRAASEQALAAKRREFPDGRYLDQIEKNAVYLALFAQEYIRVSAQYLVKGQPRLRRYEVDHYVNQLGKDPHIMTPHIIHFLQTGQVNKIVENHVGLFAGWRDLRLRGLNAKYIDEMEFSFQWYKTEFHFAWYFLTSFLNNPDKYAGSAGLLAEKEVEEAIKWQVKVHWTGLLWNHPPQEGSSD